MLRILCWSRFPLLLTIACCCCAGVRAETDEQLAGAFVADHCMDCHTGEDAERGFDLTGFVGDLAGGKSADTERRDRETERRDRDTERSDKDTERWEKVLLRIQSRQMPPPDSHDIDEEAFQSVQAAMARVLDRRFDSHPHAGRTAPLRRLTRTEYQNSVRDLLDLQLDVKSLLPADSSSDGFDNITVGELSPLLLDRYLTAAQRISRAAVGSRLRRPGGVTVRLPADQSQEHHVEGLPFGTRGGTSIQHHFPVDGEYEIQVRLTRDRDEQVEGLKETHELDILLDRARKHRFVVKPPKAKDHTLIDADLNVRVTVNAGAHDVGVTFVNKFSSLQEIKRKPFDASYNRHRHPRRTPAVAEVSIVGPFSELDSGEESESRRKVFIARSESGEDPSGAARTVFASIMRKAYRRPVTDADLAVPMRFFSEAMGRTEADGFDAAFDAGIEAGLTTILVNPNFLFRTAEQPKGAKPGEIYALPATELASRLSYFLWSSLPDDALLDAAEAGTLADPTELATQVQRMLADDRSRSLVDSFADQWLYLRNLPTITPDLRQFPSFDNNLREAFAEETRRLFADVVARDASVLELIQSEHTFLNERLAIHYGIPKVVGSHFRRVDLPADSHRGGLLRHGSVLMATSYATRTSPTIRGAWILENILGTPPPPPPPNVPTIKEKSPGEKLTFREALAKHRDDATCASCHDLIDPVGFALDRYDAVGRWREHIEGDPVDAGGSLPDGQTVVGVKELEEGILTRPELFVSVLVEKLLTYGLGRPVTHEDGPAVRRIVRAAADQDYRFSALVTGIAQSIPFTMRTSQ